MEDYRVSLDKYNGPLDLLLYLIRREELDIYDIPIARITEQYIGYVDLLKQSDPNLAGEFLVMAASLLEIKTRMLLPNAPALDGGEEEEGLGDPRSELVRQLLEYKAFKDAAMDLREAGEVHAQKFPRRPPTPEGGEDDAVEIEDVQIWDLFDAFSKILEAIGHRSRSHNVIYDDTPTELHAADILDRLQREGRMSFVRIFEGRGSRNELLGLFLALLELIRQRKVRCVQETNFGEIAVDLRAPEPEAPDEEMPAQLPAEPAPAAEPADQSQPTPAPEGAYESDGPEEDDDGLGEEFALPADLVLPDDPPLTEKNPHDAGTDSQGPRD